MTLKRAQGETQTILRGNIEKMASSGLSLMPADLEKGVTVQEMADLIDFIRRLGEK